MNRTILIKGGTLITINRDDAVLSADLLVEDGRIAAIGTDLGQADELIDATGCFVLPGFVQTHIHLCQTLFRNSADDLSLLDWLRKRIWPMEAAHSPQSLRASARLGIAELIRGGTTCALTMETVNYTEEVLRAVEETGFRAIVGKCMMDKGAQVPAALLETSEASIAAALKLVNDWHNRADGRIKCCFAPRFAVSCTTGLLAQVAALARSHGVLVHTHACESLGEIELVHAETGLTNIAYLGSLDLLGQHVVLAHCVHVDQQELALLAESRTNVAHCPSSNLKLSSGIAPIVEMIEQGISVSLGADGAPCNNRLDMFTEMRSAALLQKVRRGPEALPARVVLRMATMGGASALGLENEIGSLEVGKRADICIVNGNAVHITPAKQDPVAALVYAAQSSDVSNVLIDGEVLLRDGKLTRLDFKTVIADADAELESLMQRCTIN